MKMLVNSLMLLVFLVSPLHAEETISTQGESYNIAKRDRNSSSNRSNKNTSRRTSKSRSRVKPTRDKSLLAQALSYAKSGQYQIAAQELFKLSLDPRYKDQRMQIKYILGLMLYQMDFDQLSAFQFISVIKKMDPKYLKQSLEKLSMAADKLGDDTLLNYAISRVQVEKFPRSMRDMLYYRIGEYQIRAKSYSKAAQSFQRVKRTSNFFEKAKYLEAQSYAELGKVKKSIELFNDLYDSQANKSVTDPARVSALVGSARAYYQGKNWDKSIELYRQVPRDTEVWHDTLFESSWAMLRSGRFRSALSNFQTIHSSFYQNFYLPEALLLRSIVYLYICKHDEMEKVLNLFNTIYKPVYKDLLQYLKDIKMPSEIYDEVDEMMEEFKENGEEMNMSKFRLPFIVGRQISKEGDFKRSRNYIKKIEAELRKLYQMPNDWKNSSLGRYAERILKTRLDKAIKKAGRQLRRHLVNIRFELFDLFEQEGFIRFEMLNGKKEMMKKRVAGKELPKTIDEETERDFFVQNGYQYWPFQGEYWLDELGNYHYIGTQSCE
ncbi:MAG: tetratricopeptide repeat protein [Bdellovibrionaceae bacterium]|nr:tetratricopeptide repeat protein [Pseudobdellovibrionaceae bacterium]